MARRPRAHLIWLLLWPSSARSMINGHFDENPAPRNIAFSFTDAERREQVQRNRKVGVLRVMNMWLNGLNSIKELVTSTSGHVFELKKRNSYVFDVKLPTFLKPGNLIYSTSGIRSFEHFIFKK